MSMGEKLKDRISRVRRCLTSLDQQPLAKATLVIIIFLDLFIITAIFNGLDQHTRQLSSPDEYIHSTCREIVINRNWNPTNRTDNLSQIITSASGSYYRVEDKKKDRHPVCAPYNDIIDRIKSDKSLTGIFEERSKSVREVNELQRKIDNLKGAYDTSLLETIAQKQEEESKVDAIRKEYQEKTEALNTLKQKVASLEKSIEGDIKVSQFWSKLQGLKDQDRQSLLGELRTLNFWFPVKKLGMQLLFLLPLFAVFYAWNSASIRKNNAIQTLVTSHLLGVSFIPILCKIIETVYEIIPKKLLKQVIDLLESLKLVAIWHYLIMALAVGAALLLIYVFQKKLFSREKLLERRISRGECQQCGKHLPAGTSACPFCGFMQFTTCCKCNGQKHVHGKYCRECGTFNMHDNHFGSRSVH